MVDVQQQIGEAIDRVSLALREVRHSLHSLDGHPTGNPDMDDWMSKRLKNRIEALTQARASLELAYSTGGD